jgi:hypothetical protein
MRYLLLIASLALAGNALAEEKPKSLTKELDKSSPILATTSTDSDSTNDSTKEQRGVVAPRDAASGMATGKRTHASPAEGADYNSSRSNKTHGLSSSGNGGSSSSGGTRAQDYNSSRSNTTSLREDKAGDFDRDGLPDVLTCGNGVDNDCDDTDVDVRPANHNTTRSNRTQPRDRGPGSDGDSRLREVRCSTRSADCVDAANGDDPVLRKRPGR